MARGNKIGITAELDDKVSGKLDKVRDNFDRLGKSAGAKSILQGVGIGAGISAFNLLGSAVSSVAGFMGDAVTKAREEEAGIARLTTSLQANIDGYDGNRDAIEAVIAEREKLAFSDGEQRDSLALLVARTHDVNEALDLNRQAMDLARLKGFDLATSSEVIGKVYSGNVAILKRYGIAVKDGASATEALAEIQETAAGQAQAFAETGLGATQQFDIAVDDLQETLGGLVSGPMTALVGVVTEQVRAIDEMVQSANELGGVLEALGVTIPETGSSFTDYLANPVKAVTNDIRVLRQMSDEAAASNLRFGDTFEGGLQTLEAFQAELAETGGTAYRTARATGTLVDDVNDAADAYDDWRDAIHDATDALNDQKRGHEETGLKIKGVKLDLKEAKGELDKLSAVKRPTLDQQIDMNNLRLRILEDRDELALLKTDLKTAGRIRADVTIDAMNDLGKSVGATDLKVQALIRHLSMVGVPLSPPTSQYHDDGTHGRAGGGPVYPGQSYTVGEQGTETLVMGAAGGYVIPNGGSRSGGGGAPVMIVLQMDGEVVARHVDKRLYYEAARAPQSPFSG